MVQTTYTVRSEGQPPFQTNDPFLAELAAKSGAIVTAVTHGGRRL